MDGLSRHLRRHFHYVLFETSQENRTMTFSMTSRLIAFLFAFLISIAFAVPGAAIASDVDGMDFRVLDEMPVQDGGRKKPFYVFATESLLALTGRSSLKVEDARMAADEVAGRMWVRDRDWTQVPMILVDYLPMKDDAGLARDRKLFSYAELASNPRVGELLNEASAARARDSRTPLRGVLKEASAVGLRLAVFEALNNGTAFRVVPASGPVWQLVPSNQPDFVAMGQAIRAVDQEAFEESAVALREWAASVEPSEIPAGWVMALEVAYQQFHPFRWAWILYAAATITLAVTSVYGRKTGYRIGMTLATAGAVLLVAGFIARIFISGRAPVTNMYESIIWVALGTVAFALIFEAIYRSRYFLLGASPVAVVTLMVADAAPLKFDPMISPLVPVLQSNFWLTTHVLTITLSYAAFALALGVGHIALGKIIFGRKPDSALYNYIYRCLQIGVFLLAAGTLLGAVWANYSWGRFWDWDPKETWALVALLTYLFLLHGRIAGKWGGFGLAVGSILAFQTIIMAWYGVNFVLGVGLHSYGFGSGGLGYAVTFVVVEVLFVGLGITRYLQQRKVSAPKPQKLPSALQKIPAN
jgi:ABC-type transport system involved in cytochrome c biogenesis permease subunit